MFSKAWYFKKSSAGLLCAVFLFLSAVGFGSDARLDLPARQNPAAGCLSPFLTVVDSPELENADLFSILSTVFDNFRNIHSQLDAPEKDSPFILYLDIDDTLLRIINYMGSEAFCGKTYPAADQFRFPMSEWMHNHGRHASNNADREIVSDSMSAVKEIRVSQAIDWFRQKCQEEGINIKVMGLTARASMETPMIEKSFSRFGIKLDSVLFVNNSNKTFRIQQHFKSFDSQIAGCAFVDDSKRGLEKVDAFVNPEDGQEGFINLKGRKIQTRWFSLYHISDNLKYLEQVWEKELDVSPAVQSKNLDLYLNVVMRRMLQFVDPSFEDGPTDILDKDYGDYLDLLRGKLAADNNIDQAAAALVFEQIYSSLYFMISNPVTRENFNLYFDTAFMPLIRAVLKNKSIVKAMRTELLDEIMIMCVFRYVAIEDGDIKNLVRDKTLKVFKSIYSLYAHNGFEFKPIILPFEQDQYKLIRRLASGGNKVLMVPPESAPGDGRDQRSTNSAFRYEENYAGLLGYDLREQHAHPDGVRPTWSFNVSAEMENRILRDILAQPEKFTWITPMLGGRPFEDLMTTAPVSRMRRKLNARDNLLKAAANDVAAIREIIGQFSMDEITATSNYAVRDPQQAFKLATRYGALSYLQAHPELLDRYKDQMDGYSIEEIKLADTAAVKVAIINEYRSTIMKNAVFVPRGALDLIASELNYSLFEEGRVADIKDIRKISEAASHFAAKAGEAVGEPEMVEILGNVDKKEFKEFTRDFVQNAKVSIVPTRFAQIRHERYSVLNNIVRIFMPGSRITFKREPQTGKIYDVQIEIEKDFWQQFIGRRIDNNEIFIIEDILGRAIAASYVFSTKGKKTPAYMLEAMSESLVKFIYKDRFDKVIDIYEKVSHKSPPAKFDVEKLTLDTKKAIYVFNKVEREKGFDLGLYKEELVDFANKILKRRASQDHYYYQNKISLTLLNGLKDSIDSYVKHPADITRKALLLNLQIFDFVLDECQENTKDFVFLKRYMNASFLDKVEISGIKRHDVDDITKQYIVELDISSPDDYSVDEVIDAINLIYKYEVQEFTFARSVWDKGKKKWRYEFRRPGSHGHLGNMIFIYSQEQPHTFKQVNKEFKLDSVISDERIAQLQKDKHDMLVKFTGLDAPQPSRQDIVDLVAACYVLRLAESLENLADNQDFTQMDILSQVYKELELFLDDGFSPIAFKGVLALDNLGISADFNSSLADKETIQEIQRKMEKELVKRDSFISQVMEKAFAQFRLSEIHSHISGSIEPDVMMSFYWADPASRRDFVDLMVVNDMAVFKRSREKTPYTPEMMDSWLKAPDGEMIWFGQPQQGPDFGIEAGALRTVVDKLENYPDSTLAYMPSDEAATDVIFYLACSGRTITRDDDLDAVAEEIMSYVRNFDWYKAGFSEMEHAQALRSFLDARDRLDKKDKSNFDKLCGGFERYVRFVNAKGDGDILAYLFILETGNIPLRTDLQPVFTSVAMADKVFKDYQNGVRSLEIRSSGARPGSKYTVGQTVGALERGVDMGLDLIKRKGGNPDDMEASLIICFRKELKPIMGAAFNKYAKADSFYKQKDYTLAEEYDMWLEFLTQALADPDKKQFMNNEESMNGFVYVFKRNGLFEKLISRLDTYPSNTLGEMVQELIDVLNRTRDMTPQKRASLLKRAGFEDEAGFIYCLKSMREILKGIEAQKALEAQMDGLLEFRQDLVEIRELLSSAADFIADPNALAHRDELVSLLGLFGMDTDTADAEGVIKAVNKCLVSRVRYQDILNAANINPAQFTSAQDLRGAAGFLSEWYERVVAVDTVGAEYQSKDELTNPYPDWIHDMAIQQAITSGLMVTEHAGESWLPERGDTIFDSLDRIMVAIKRGAERIGHATALRIDPRNQFDSRFRGKTLFSNLLVNQMILRDDFIESCLTSNYLLQNRIASFVDHPFLSMLSVGLKVVPATDNSGILNTSMPREMGLATMVHNLSVGGVARVFENMNNSSFRKMQENKEKERQNRFEVARSTVVLMAGDPMAGKTTVAQEVLKRFKYSRYYSHSEIIRFLTYATMMKKVHITMDNVDEILKELEVRNIDGKVFYSHPMVDSSRLVSAAEFNSVTGVSVSTSVLFHSIVANEPVSNRIREWIAQKAAHDAEVQDAIGQPALIVIEGRRNTVARIEYELSQDSADVIKFNLFNGNVHEGGRTLLTLRNRVERPDVDIESIFTLVLERMKERDARLIGDTGILVPAGPRKVSQITNEVVTILSGAKVVVFDLTPEELAMSA